MKDKIKGEIRKHLQMPIPSRNPESKVYKTYTDFIKGAPDIVRKYCIAKKCGLLAFDKQKCNEEKSMASFSLTPMLIDKPFDDIENGEKSTSAAAKRKASEAVLAP